MEHLVIELNKLKFQQISKSKYANKCYSLPPESHSFLRQQSSAVVNCYRRMNETAVQQTVEPAPKFSQNVENTDGNKESDSFSSLSMSSEEETFDASEEESEVDVAYAKSSKRTRSRGGVDIRKMPIRSAKKDFLHSRNLRTAMKPPKTSSRTTQELSPAEIKKIYANKFKNFRPTCLETIFEEPQQMRGSDQVRLVGAKKLRRCLVFSDGLKSVNKAVLNRRRAKIKKNLGRRVTLKKIPLKNFLNHIQSSLSSENEDDYDKSDQVNMIKNLSSSLKTVNEIQDCEMDLPAESGNM